MRRRTDRDDFDQSVDECGPWLGVWIRRSVGDQMIFGVDKSYRMAGLISRGKQNARNVMINVEGFESGKVGIYSVWIIVWRGNEVILRRTWIHLQCTV